MLDSKSLIDYSLNLPSAIEKTAELEQRLGLYQVFLKLYEHHRELLDEILDLENTGSQQRSRGVWQYVQGVVSDHEVFLTTNLIQEKTQVLRQPQRAWVIGRDSTTGLSIPDKRLSRRHALIQYVEHQGFHLLDLNSTNGSYINGEPVRRSTVLKDGDRVRLGSLSFLFFICEGASPVVNQPTSVVSEAVLPASSLSTLVNRTSNTSPVSVSESLVDEELPTGSEKDTSMFLKPEIGNSDRSDVLTNSQKAEILDRFFKR